MKPLTVVNFVGYGFILFSLYMMVASFTWTFAGIFLPLSLSVHDFLGWVVAGGAFVLGLAYVKKRLLQDAGSPSIQK